MDPLQGYNPKDKTYKILWWVSCVVEFYNCVLYVVWYVRSLNVWILNI